MTAENASKLQNKNTAQKNKPLSSLIIEDIIKSLLVSLHSHEILETFALTLRKHLKFSSLKFIDDQKALKLNLGSQQEFELSYNLSDEQVSNLGTIVFSRDKKFNSKELNLIEESLSLLVLSLKNAKLHEKALANAERDPLTGLLNRYSLEERLEREIKLARRNNNGLSILMADIDYFKQINDTFGHQIGDKILKHTAKILKKTARGIDLIFRIGGEEFLIISNNTSSKGAYNLANRIVKAIEQASISLQGRKINYTISVGISHLMPKDTKQNLLKRSDMALYEAKAQGRNQVVVDELL